MNITEANAVSRLLGWLIGEKDVTVERAREDAEWLAARSYNVLSCGITQKQVEQRWLRSATTAIHEGSTLSPERLAEIEARAVAEDIPALAEEVRHIHGTAVSQAEQLHYLQQVIAAAKLAAPGWIEGVTPMSARCEHDVIVSTGTWLRPQLATGYHPECLRRGLQEREVSV